MINQIGVKFNPSFKSVIPINVSLYNNSQQLSLNLPEENSGPKRMTDKEFLLRKKAAQSLVRILAKAEKEDSLEVQSRNNMIRKFMSVYDKDYKIPNEKIESKDNNIARLTYSGHQIYLLTGRQAENYAKAGKKIGEMTAYDSELNDQAKEQSEIWGNEEPPEDHTFERRSRRSWGYTKDGITNSGSYLKTPSGQPASLYIYAEETEHYKKATTVQTTSIDFKLSGTRPKHFR